MGTNTREEFEVVAETEVDARGRISLGRAGAKPGRRYRVESDPDGVLLLTPVVSIPERELLVWTDHEVADRVRRGVQQAREGKTKDLGGFSQYLAEDETEE
ncbi:MULTISPECIES: hypothetical protein [Streptomyces griseus group]|uniref:hypothetical protein n=1 Tax=Streptomyces griseus group TaxID=629295 RepID=UPI0004ABCC6C|nr:hypothetical protein [Streptomyces baarnensis]